MCAVTFVQNLNKEQEDYKVEDIEKYQKEDLLQIVKLMEEGRSYKEAVSVLVPSNIMNITHKIHQMICHKRHHPDAPDPCLYYESLEAKQPWIDTTTLLCKEHTADTVEYVVAGLPTIIEEVVKVEREEGQNGLLVLSFFLEKIREAISA